VEEDDRCASPSQCVLIERRGREEGREGWKSEAGTREWRRVMCLPESVCPVLRERREGGREEGRKICE